MAKEFLVQHWQASLLAAAAAASTAIYASYIRRKRVDMKRSAIFISGCDSGFGYSLALHCQQNLGLVVIAGCFEPDKEGGGAKTLAKEKNVFVIPLDVTDNDSIRLAREETERILRETDTDLWCVVNNAALLVFAEAEWQTRNLVTRQLDVNVLGPLLLSKSFLPLLRKSRGRIVNMISFCTDCPLPTLTVYTASKAALRSLSAGMRMELSKFGVDVVMFNPGDHPGETPLCSDQERHYEEMEAEVKKISDYEENEERFGRYFKASREKFTKLFPKPLEVARLRSPGLYRTFDELLGARWPRAEYVNSDLGTKFFFGTLRVLPTSWSDKARLALMRLPKFL